MLKTFSDMRLNFVEADAHEKVFNELRMLLHLFVWNPEFVDILVFPRRTKQILFF